MRGVFQSSVDDWHINNYLSTTGFGVDNGVEVDSWQEDSKTASASSKTDNERMRICIVLTI